MHIVNYVKNIHSSSILVRQPIKEKENSEFKLAILRWKIDFMPHSGERLGKCVQY